jgi:ribosomal protein S18 acetylase RimI-like enzyme
MIIKQLNDLDMPQYRALMLHAYAAAPDAFTSTPEERASETDAWWLKRVADPSGLSLAFGAFQDHQLIGTVTVEFASKPKTQHKAKLIGMFVHESCRGLGLGKQLIDAALAAIRARAHICVIMLTVTEGNMAALHLYEQLGFQTFGTEPMAIATPSGFKSKVHMWRALP